SAVAAEKVRIAPPRIRTPSAPARCAPRPEKFSPLPGNRSVPPSVLSALPCPVPSESSLDPYFVQNASCTFPATSCSNGPATCMFFCPREHFPARQTQHGILFVAPRISQQRPPIAALQFAHAIF